MFRRILVPLDGSERAESALPIAARIARSGNGTLVLMRVVEAITPYGPYLSPPTGPATPFSDEARDKAASYLAGLATSEMLAGITTVTRVGEGPAARTILDIAGGEHADLIVMCMHGQTGYRRWVLGSVSQHVARHAPMPVFIVREQQRLPLGGEGQPSRAFCGLVPLDGSILAEAVLGPAADLVTALSSPAGGALDLLAVVDPVLAKSSDIPETQVVEDLSVYLQRLTQRVSGAGSPHPDLHVSHFVVVDTDVAARVIEAAEHDETEQNQQESAADAISPCDVIAMATHGRSGVARWALGSITERVLQTTTRPMLIVRPELSDAEALEAEFSALTSEIQP